MNLQSAMVLLLSGICMVTDLKSGRICNAVTYPSVILGIVLSLFFTSPGFGQSAIGVIATLFLYGMLYKLGGFGAGDVKLMAAIGAFKGFPFVIYSSFYIIVAACVFGLFVLAWKGRLFPAVKWAGGMLWGMVIPGANRPAMRDEMTTMPFAPAIFVGTAYAIYMETVNGPFTVG